MCFLASKSVCISTYDTFVYILWLKTTYVFFPNSRYDFFKTRRWFRKVIVMNGKKGYFDLRLLNSVLKNELKVSF